MRCSLVRVIAATAPRAWLMPLTERASVTAAQFRASGASAKIQTQPLRNGVTVLVGSGGNVFVLSRADGKLCIESGLATSRKQIIAALAGVSDSLVRHLVNTHWHFDHTDGNLWMN